MSAKNLLLLSIEAWPYCCRHPKVLHNAGFDVTVCAVKKDPLHLSRYIKNHIDIPERFKTQNQLLSFLGEACLKAKADFILPCDDKAVQILAALHNGIKEDKEPAKQKMTKLIEASRGNPEFYPHTFNKFMTVELANEIGIQTPEETLCKAAKDAVNFASGYGFPVVLKSEIGTAGAQVAICKTVKETQEQFKALSRGGPLIAQHYIEGKPAMCNAAALNGKILASMVFSKEECYPDAKGPSAVVKLIDHKAIKKATEKFIKHTGYTGILSLDFMVDNKNKAHLIECNPRPTPASHLGHVINIDLFKALYAALNDETYTPGKHEQKTVALFPKELSRDRNSDYLYNAYHDVPWDEPEIVGYLLSTVRR